MKVYLCPSFSYHLRIVGPQTRRGRLTSVHHYADAWVAAGRAEEEGAFAIESDGSKRSHERPGGPNPDPVPASARLRSQSSSSRKRQHP